MALVENEIQIRVQEELQHLLTSDPIQAIMLAAKAIQQVKQEKEQAISELTNHIKKDLMPKVDMYEAVMSSADVHELSTVAKLLNFKGMGRNKLFSYLRDKGLLRSGNEPYQEYVQRHLFEIKLETYDKGFGIMVYPKTMVTHKGLEYIRNLLLEDGYELN